MHSMLLRPAVLVCACLSVLACGDPAADIRAEQLAKAEATLAEASPEIQERVRQTCERWQDRDLRCDRERVQADALDCWLEKGLPHLEAALERGIRQRARNRRVVMQHSLCMEKRGWRLRPGSGGYF